MATCSDGSPVSAIDVSEGETITCTFTNRLQNAGKLTIRLDAIPDDADRFLFRLTGPTRYNGILLQDNGDPGDGINNLHTVLVNPGSGYNLFLQQRDPGDWSQRSAICSDGSPVTNIDVAPLEEVTCTFTYDQPSSRITVVEDSLPNDSQDFGFTFREPGFPAHAVHVWDDDGNSTNDLSNARSFVVQPGSGYSVEAGSAPFGWDLTSATCSDGSPLSDIRGLERRGGRLYLHAPQAGSHRRRDGCPASEHPGIHVQAGGALRAASRWSTTARSSPAARLAR